jgi:hypothetical protein
MTVENCPGFDTKSSVIYVSPCEQLNTLADIYMCNNPVACLFPNELPKTGVTYTWTPCINLTSCNTPRTCVTGITQPTTYTLTVKKGEGCEAKTTITVHPPKACTLNGNITQIRNDCSVELTANYFDNQGNVTYLWSTGEKTQSIKVSGFTTTLITCTIKDQCCSTMIVVNVAKLAFKGPFPNVNNTDRIFGATGISKYSPIPINRTMPIADMNLNIGDVPAFNADMARIELLDRWGTIWEGAKIDCINDKNSSGARKYPNGIPNMDLAWDAYGVNHISLVPNDDYHWRLKATNCDRRPEEVITRFTFVRKTCFLFWCWRKTVIQDWWYITVVD